MCLFQNIALSPTQILNNSQSDWSKAEAPLSERHLKL